MARFRKDKGIYLENIFVARLCKKQKEKLSTLQGKLIYKQRMHDVEGVFANIKKNLRFASFNLRGFAGVRIEWTLISLAHNLKKVL